MFITKTYAQGMVVVGFFCYFAIISRPHFILSLKYEERKKDTRQTLRIQIKMIPNFHCSISLALSYRKSIWQFSLSQIL